MSGSARHGAARSKREDRGSTHDEPRTSTATRSRKQGKHFTQRGIALIVVMVALMMGAIVTKELSTNVNVDAFGADNATEQMRADFLARSALNLSELILRLQQTLDQPEVKEQLGAVQLTDYADLFMSAFGGTPEEVAATTGLVGEEAKGFGADIGAFGVSIRSDDGKINLNCANGKPEYAQLTYTLVDAMYYFPAFDPLFQVADADGWQRDRRRQTEAIIDYIDSGLDQVSAPGAPKSGASEDYDYSKLKYKAKNNYLDTLDEAKMIRGVDDRFWTLFSPALTVYGGCKLNVRTVEDPRILAALIFLTVKNEDDPVVRDGQLLWYHATAVAYAKDNGYFFDTLEDFEKFVKDPEGAMMMGITEATAAAGGTTTPPAVQFPGVPVGLDLGVELDHAKVEKVLRAGPQRTYRVEAWGEITRNQPYNPIRRELTAEWDMGNVNVNPRATDQRSRNGAWVHLKKQ